MGAAKVELLLEFAGVEPEVVGVAFGDPLAAGVGVGEDVVDAEAAVLLGAEDAELVGGLALVGPADGEGVVWRGVVGDDDLEGEVGFLGEDGLKRLADGLGGLVGADGHGDYGGAYARGRRTPRRRWRRGRFGW